MFSTTKFITNVCNNKSICPDPCFRHIMVSLDSRACTIPYIYITFNYKIVECRFLLKFTTQQN